MLGLGHGARLPRLPALFKAQKIAFDGTCRTFGAMGRTRGGGDDAAQTHVPVAELSENVVEVPATGYSCGCVWSQELISHSRSYGS